MILHKGTRPIRVILYAKERSGRSSRTPNELAIEDVLAVERGVVGGSPRGYHHEIDVAGGDFAGQGADLAEGAVEETFDDRGALSELRTHAHWVDVSGLGPAHDCDDRRVRAASNRAVEKSGAEVVNS